MDPLRPEPARTPSGAPRSWRLASFGAAVAAWVPFAAVALAAGPGSADDHRPAAPAATLPAQYGPEGWGWGYGRPRAWDEIGPRAYERPGEVPGYARARPLAAGAACVARDVTCATARPAYEGAACACPRGKGLAPARGRVERW